MTYNLAILKRLLINVNANKERNVLGKYVVRISVAVVYIYIYMSEFTYVKMGLEGVVTFQ